MNKKITKILLICINIIIIFSQFGMLVSYADQDSLSASNIIGGFDNVETNISNKSEKVIDKTIGTIWSALKIVATGVAIITITFLGIKYMSAAPTEKASIKSQLITFTIGAAVTFGAVSILELAQKTATGIFQ